METSRPLSSATLAALRGFYVTKVNEEWFQTRFSEWKTAHKGSDLQSREESEADDFLEGFWSPGTGKLWDEDYAVAFEKASPPIEAKSINVWNPGCGKGYKKWAFACVMRRRYPEARIKIWANTGPPRDFHGPEHGLPRGPTRVLSTLDDQGQERSCLRPVDPRFDLLRNSTT